MPLFWIATGIISIFSAWAIMSSNEVKTQQIQSNERIEMRKMLNYEEYQKQYNVWKQY